MNHRRFVVTSTVSMLFVAGLVAGLAFYSNVSVKASIPNLPDALGYLPADCQAVFGVNVEKFVKSPVFLKFQEKHGREIAPELGLFISNTGVDPVNDLSYIVAAGRSREGKKGSGVVIAVAKDKFNADRIIGYIKTKAVPMEITYGGARVLMIPESGSDRVEKGIVFLKNSEIAMGDLDSLKSVIDAGTNPALGIEANASLLQLIRSLDSQQMFWFAGDAASILAKAPTNTPLGPSISSVVSVVGTLNFDEAVAGKITANAKDAESAQKLSDVVRGFVALGQLAGDQNPALTELLKGLTVSMDKNQVSLALNFSYDLLEKLQHAGQQLKSQAKKI
jgi:hypothetical protein